MENKYEYWFILMKEEIENNKQEMKADLKDIKETLKIFTAFMMDQTNKLATLMKDQNNISKSSPAQKDTTTPPDSPGYLLINAHLRHIATNHNHCSLSVILIFIRRNSRRQKDPTRWRTRQNNSSSS